MKHLEDIHQENFFCFLQLKYPNLLCFAIPNGGKRGIIEAARLKKCGVKKGVPDIFIAKASKNYHGLFVEMKKPIEKGKPKPAVSPHQKVWISNLNEEGYLAVVAYGFDEAAQILANYLDN